MAHKYENKQTALLAKVKGKTGKISDKTHEEHLKLYTGYVNKSNALLEAIEALGFLAGGDAFQRRDQMAVGLAGGRDFKLARAVFGRERSVPLHGQRVFGEGP